MTNIGTPNTIIAIHGLSLNIACRHQAHTSRLPASKKFTANRHYFIRKTCFMDMSHTHTRLTALCPGLPRWASGISWAICKSAPRSRQITTPASHHSVFYRPDALPAAQPTASEHWIIIGLLQSAESGTKKHECEKFIIKAIIQLLWLWLVISVGWLCIDWI